MKRALLAGIAAAMAVAAPAGAAAFDSGREAANVAKSRERFAHDQASPGYQAQLAIQSLAGTVSVAQYLADHPGATPINQCADPAGPCGGDSRVYESAGRFTLVRAVRYVNRNGATISAHLWAPLSRRRHAHRLPAVLIVNGDLASEEIYWYAAEVLARHGYVVMTYDPQGHGRSDTFGAGVDASRHVDVQQQATCDCVELAANEDAAEQARDALDFLLSSRARRYHPVRPRDEATPRGQPTPGQAKQRQQSRDKQVDGYDELAGFVDRRHVGIAGHSRGAYAASIVGSADRRVDAIVAWDDLLGGANREETARPVRPRVPALGMSGDYYEAPQPYTEAPDRRAKDGPVAAYRRAGVDVMHLVVRGGTHYEWSYVPNPAFPATLRGIDMATWYTQAWFDRYLRHDHRASNRLLTDRWRHDPVQRRIDLRGDRDLFSFYYRSRFVLHLPGRGLVRCLDVRAGCRALVPEAHDGYRGRYSYLRALRG